MMATKILVVEDNTIPREGLAVLLRQQGYTVLLSVDRNDALNGLSGGPVPDLILLDMLIPYAHGDGWWFLQQRKRIPSLESVPVIITTALPVASPEWTASLGAEGLIRKPFEVRPLLPGEVTTPRPSTRQAPECALRINRWCRNRVPGQDHLGKNS